MPRTVVATPALTELLRCQDGVATVGQLEMHALTPRTVNKRIERGSWRRLLPGIVLTHPGDPSRRQRLIAAWLWGGHESAIDGLDALRWYDVDVPRADLERVHVVVPALAPARSRGFVTVRRAVGEITIASCGFVPYVDPATAAIVAARNARNSREAIGLLSRALQRNACTTSDLTAARQNIGDKWCRGVDGALLAVGVGLRSPAENDLRRITATSRIFPAIRWNQWLKLDDGGPLVCVDGLIEDAGLAFEVIGKKYHAWGEVYEDTQARKERLQAAGLIVCEATPARIRTHGKQLLASFERTFLLHARRGMPAGVRIVPAPGIAR